MNKKKGGLENWENICPVEMTLRFSGPLTLALDLSGTMGVGNIP